MNLKFTPSAWDDYLWFQQHDRKLLKRINQLLADICRTPFEGIGKPEPLNSRATCPATGRGGSTMNTDLYTRSKHRTSS